MGRHKHAEAQSTVVTSDGVRRKSLTRMKRLKLWLLGGLVILLVLSAAAAYYLMGRSASNPQSTSVSDGSHQTLLAAGQEQLSKAQSAKDKSDAYAAIGNAYMNSGDYAKAAQAFQQAEPNTSNKIYVLTEIASAYSHLGQKDQAVAALQQAIAIQQASSNTALKALVPEYQGFIQQIQAGGTI